jgi:antitoxin component of MazEF toxin-antitoxin module
VVKWGNGAGVRLTARVLKKANLQVNDPVQLFVDDGTIVIRPRREVTLDSLLSRCDPKKHRHPLMLDDVPVGREFGAKDPE